MKRLPANFGLAEQLALLGEPTRLRLLRLVERQELSVGELAKVMQLPQSTVSRHLKLLLDAGWVVRRNEGTASLFRMVMDDLNEASRSLWVAVRPQFGLAGFAAQSEEDDRRLESVLAERREDSQVFFGRVAGQWDEVRNDLFGGRFTAPALLALLPSHWEVADLGCGTGNAAELLASQVRRVVAVDQSAPMLAAAKQRLSGVENVEFRHGTMENLPLADGSVDAVVCVLVLHHVADPGKAMAEMRRVLRTDRGGGVALIVDMVEHDRASYRHTMGHRWLGFSAATLSELFSNNGFAGEVQYRLLCCDVDAKGPGLFVCTARAEHRSLVEK